MLVYCVYHVKEREEKVFKLIENRLKALHPSACVEIVLDNDLVQKCIIKKPDVIIRNPIRDQLGAFATGLAKLLTGAKLIVLETEGLMNFDDIQQMKIRIGDADFSETLIDDFFVWGPKPQAVYSKLLIQQNKVSDISLVKWCGYALYDNDLLKEWSAYQDSYQKYIDIKRRFHKMIFVVTGFILAETSYEQMIEMSSFSIDEEGNPDQEAVERFYKQKEIDTNFREDYVNYILEYAKRHNDVCFVVKLHPTELDIQSSIQYYRRKMSDVGNVVIVDQDEVVAGILENSDCLIHYGSTVGLEAYIYGKPSLLIYPNEDALKNSNGVLYKSTKAICINEKDQLDDFLSGSMQFVRFAENDKFIYENFGISLDEHDAADHPIDKLIESIVDCDSAQKIKKIDIKCSRSLKIFYKKVLIKAGLERLRDLELFSAAKLIIVGLLL